MYVIKKDNQYFDLDTEKYTDDLFATCLIPTYKVALLIYEDFDLDGQGIIWRVTGSAYIDEINKGE
jgi:hypothetical protein